MYFEDTFCMTKKLHIMLSTYIRIRMLSNLPNLLMEYGSGEFFVVQQPSRIRKEIISQKCDNVDLKPLYTCILYMYISLACVKCQEANTNTHTNT